MPSSFENVEINSIEDLEALIEDVQTKLEALGDEVSTRVENITDVLETLIENANGVGPSQQDIDNYLQTNFGSLLSAISVVEAKAADLETYLSDAAETIDGAIADFANADSISGENIDAIISDDTNLEDSEALLENIEADFNGLVAQIAAIYDDAKAEIEACVADIGDVVDGIEIPETALQDGINLIGQIPGGFQAIPQIAGEANALVAAIDAAQEDFAALADIEIPAEVLIQPVLAALDDLELTAGPLTITADVNGDATSQTVSLNVDYNGSSFLRGSITASLAPIDNAEHVIDLGDGITLYITSDVSPIAKNVDLGAIDEDTSITFTEAQLLAQSIDFDGDDLSVSSVSVDPSVGTIVDNGDGTYTFTPAQDLNGDDFEIAFTVTDGVYEDGAIARIDINPVSDTPTNGDDFLVGTEGNDCINGLGGDDIINGLGGNDYLYGGSGNDILIGGEGADYLNGGYGFDTVDYSGSSEGVAVLLQGTGCTLDSNFNFKRAGGYNGEAQGDRFCSIEAVIGSEFNDFVYGGRYGTTADLGAGDDIFDASYYYSGRDVVDGGAGNDIIRTGNGNDVIDGGTGDDILFGERGRDTFVFGEDSGNDVIKDFSTHWYYGDSISLEVDGFDSFADVQAAATQSGSWWNPSTTIDLGDGNSVTLEGVGVHSLDADMFGFEDDGGWWGC